MKLERTFAAAALAALVLAAGCGEDDDSSDPATTTTAVSGPLVEYSRTGGIAAMEESLVIEADGTGTYEIGEPEPSSRKIELDENELDELGDLLAEASLDGEQGAPSGCADCFVYTVTAGDATASLDDVTLLDAPGSVQQLVGYLNDLAADAAAR